MSRGIIMDFRTWFLGFAGIILLKMIGLDALGMSKPKTALEMTISGEWSFKQGDASEWSDPLTDDAAWTKIQVPSRWDSAYDGYGWYRYHVVIPENWKGESSGFIFDIGKIDDSDEFYFNGRLLGRSTGWETWRKYAIPKGIIKFGEDNVIAIRVNDTGGDGGIWEGPIKIMLGTVRNFDIEKY